MNNREVLQALLDGKRIRVSTWDQGEYVVPQDNSFVNQKGQVVALEFWQGRVWEIYQEPNPHTAGTLAWAREEVQRGNRIRRPLWPGSWDSSALGAGLLTVDDIDAQDWQSLPPESPQATSRGEMKLYLLTREDASGYRLDKTHAVMVRATSDHQARLLASQEHGDEGSGVWLSHDVVCVEIPVVGPSGVLLADKG